MLRSETTEETLPGLVQRRAAEHADMVAIRSVEFGQATWGEIEREARRWAGALTMLGVKAGDCVVTVMPNSPLQYILWTAISWLRAIEVPMNPAYRGEWIKNVFADAQPTVAIIAEKYLEPILDSASALAGLRTLIVAHGDAPKTELPFDVVDANAVLGAPLTDLPTPSREDIACVIYTSGTTGRSKGAMFSWAQLYFATSAPAVSEEHRPKNPEEVTYAPFGPFHLTGRSPFFGAAIHGSRIVTREFFSLNAFWSDIRQYGCTSTVLVGPMAPFLLAQPPQADDADNSLTMVIMAPVLPEVEAFKRRFGLEVFTLYNMSELSVPFISGDPVTARDYASCGHKRPGCSVRLMNERGEEVGPDVVGELWVKTDDPLHLTRGYLGMPEKSKEAFQDGWFKTGDLFKRDRDGNFYFVDRLKDYIRRRGENIASFEIEAAVNQHPAVAASAAVAVPSEWGEDDVKITVALRDGAKATPEELIAFLTPRIPKFALPRYVEFVAALPVTMATGRIQKNVLREAGVTPQTWDREKAQSTR